MENFDISAEANMIGNDVLRAIQERRSIRKFLPDKLENDEMESILQAGAWAASGKGLQTAVMVVVDNPEDVETLRKANAEIWGRPDVDPFYGAPNIVVVLGDGDEPNWLQDGSLVMGNLMLAAYSVGAGSCWINRAMEYFDRPDGKAMLEKWNLPAKYRGVAICALGYPMGDLPKAKARKQNYIIHV